MKFLQVEEPHKYSPGPTLLLAGPGSGKTHSLALRVKWLVEIQGVDPKAITVITFTAEAARNMRLRLSDEDKKDVYMAKETQPEIISTMHSLGHQIIGRRLPAALLSENFTVLSSEELRTALFGDAAQILGYPRKVGEETKLARMKAERMTTGSPQAKICDAYIQILRRCNALDHDDQIRVACEVLRGDNDLLEEYQGKARHLLVDEYQDINADQFGLIHLLSKKSQEGLYVVGDDDQSIYGFRGGSPDYIRSFDKHFTKSAPVLTLPHCRRCPPKVLNGALEVAKKFNVGRLDKPDPRSTSTDETPIMVYDFPSDSQEAAFIAETCKKVFPSRDVLILVPTRRFAEPITRALRRYRIPYDWRPSLEDEGLSRVSRLFDFLSDPRDSLALRHCVEILSENGVLGIPGSRSRKKDKLDSREEMLKHISTLWNGVLKGGQVLSESLQTGAGAHGVLKLLNDHIRALQKAYESRIDVFLEAIGKVLRPWGKPDELAAEIRSWMAEIVGRSRGGEGIARILTMRMAKGLEADHVFLVGLEEGVFPSSKWAGDELLEAVRLFYVSMTRAKAQLHISHVRKRDASVTFLPASYALRPSSFLNVLPKDCIEVRYVPRGARKKGGEREGKVGKERGGKATEPILV